jgi:hypothetical protein
MLIATHQFLYSEKKIGLFIVAKYYKSYLFIVNISLCSYNFHYLK